MSHKRNDWEPDYDTSGTLRWIAMGIFLICFASMVGGLVSFFSMIGGWFS